jgi:uncharacterized Ntn-hydrolase superfamily protein
VTFSLVGRCPRTGMVGTAVTSSSPAVAARCAHARAGAGAAASQNVTDPRLGPAVLDMMAAGRPAQQAVDAALAKAPGAAYRQLTAVDEAGSTGAFSGAHTLGTNAVACGEGAVAAGNLLGSAAVPGAMVAAFAADPGLHLGARLVAALRAGLDAGGEEGPVRSAGLVVCDRVEWPVVDLRVDWDDDPIGRLAELWSVWEPQISDYVTRALDPGSSPSFAVPGDE